MVRKEKKRKESSVQLNIHIEEEEKKSDRSFFKANYYPNA